MIARLEIEVINLSSGKWQTFNYLEIDVPFAKSRYNFVLNVVGEFSRLAGLQAVPPGKYRIGMDEKAVIEWDGSRPKITYQKDGEAVDPEVSDAFFERN